VVLWVDSQQLVDILPCCHVRQRNCQESREPGPASVGTLALHSAGNWLAACAVLEDSSLTQTTLSTVNHLYNIH